MTTFTGLMKSVVEQQAHCPHQNAEYSACILSKVLYDNESWTLYSRQEKRFNDFHMCSLPCNTEFLTRAGIRNMFTLLSQHQLHQLRHVRCKADGRI